MGVNDEWHRQTIMECLDELCKGGSSVVSSHTRTHIHSFLNSIYCSPPLPQVPVVGLEGDEMVDMGENFRRLQGMALSASLSSIPSMFAGNKRTISQHLLRATVSKFEE